MKNNILIYFIFLFSFLFSFNNKVLSEELQFNATEIQSLEKGNKLIAVDGVEINPYLVNIGKDTQKFLNINNVDLHPSRFEDFKTTKKFDIIFSLANDDTIDGNTEFTFDEYIKKIQGLLNEGGHLMWETISPDTYDPELFKPKRLILEKKFTLLEEKMVKSEYPVNVPERRFLVFQNN